MVANASGEIVAKVKGEGTNHWQIGIPEVGRRIAAMSADAKLIADIPDSVKFKCIGLSLSGCEHESTNATLEKEMRKEYPDLAESYVVCSDTMGSILTVSNLGGVVIIAGTGSNACLRNPNGGEFIDILIDDLASTKNFQKLSNAEVGVTASAMKAALGGFPTNW